MVTATQAGQTRQLTLYVPIISLNTQIEYTHTYWPANVVAFSETICFVFMLNDWLSTKLSEVVVWMLTADKYVVQASLEISAKEDGKIYLAM